LLIFSTQRSGHWSSSLGQIQLFSSHNGRFLGIRDFESPVSLWHWSGKILSCYHTNNLVIKINLLRIRLCSKFCPVELKLCFQINLLKIIKWPFSLRQKKNLKQLLANGGYLKYIKITFHNSNLICHLVMNLALDFYFLRINFCSQMC